MVQQDRLALAAGCHPGWVVYGTGDGNCTY